MRSLLCFYLGHRLTKSRHVGFDQSVACVLRVCRCDLIHIEWTGAVQ